MLKGSLTFKGGWSGGTYLVDSVPVTFKENDKAFLIVSKNGNEQYFCARFLKIRGKDDDMGHEYPWTMVDIGVLDGNLVPRFLSVRELLRSDKKITVRIDFEENDA